MVLGLTLVWALLTPAAVAADKEPYVVLEGVRFYCDGCLQLDEKFCALPQSTKSVLIPCAEAFDYLLRANLSLAVETPLNVELVDYLKRGAASSERVALILEVFKRRGQFSDVQADTLAVLLREYPDVLQAALADGWGDDEVVKRLWSLLTGVHDPKLRGIKGIVAARLPDFELALFVRELDAALEEDLGLLSVAATFAMQLQTPQAETLVTLQKAVERCSQAHGSVSGECAQAAMQPQLDASRSYLISILVDTVLVVLTDEEQDIETKVKVLEELPLPQLHASDAMAITSAALRVLHRESDKLSLAQLERSRLAELLASSGSSERHLVEEVSQLVQKVQAREALASKPQAPGVDTSPPQVAQSSTALRAGALFLCSAGLLISGAALFIVRRRGEQPTAAYRSTTELPEMSHEYREAMAFFGLTEHSSEEELRRAYRKLARTTHPDVSNSQEDFIELQEQYERAKRLFANS